MKYVYYIFATLCISLCIYSIKTGNTYGIILMAIWGVYYLIKAICTTVEARNKRKKIDQEAKELFDELTRGIK